MSTQAYTPARSGSLRKGMAIASLVLGILSLLTFGCLGIGALVGLVLGFVAAHRAGSRPAEYGGRGIAIGGIITNAIGFVLVPVAGIVAAIAIPSLLRARVAANEASAIGDTRTVISAQAAYQSANGGFYEGRLQCLATPSACIPGYSESGPVFLDTRLASLETKMGYSRQLRAGAGIDAIAPVDSEQRRRLSPTSVASYAYLALPVKHGNTGVRAFCGDASGTICYTTDGREPEVTPEGSCDLSSCRQLE